MPQSKIQVSAEEIGRAREKNQKRRQNKKHFGTKAQQETESASLGTVLRSQMKEEEATPNQNLEWEMNPNEWRKYMTPDGKWIPQLDTVVKELNVGWPWVGAQARLLTQAPYAVNERNFEAGFFKLPQEIQTSHLFNIPRGMEAPILQILFENHSCASKFAATCQSAFNLVASNIDHWDFSRGGFNGCDRDPKYETTSLGTVGKIVVVSPFRVRRWRGENFACSMYSLQNMTHAFVNFAECFEILHLHRIPLLTTQLLGLVIPLMTRLKVLGIYRCELLHIGDTMRLLEIVRANRSRSSGIDREVLLDFYPRFHIGPTQDSTPFGVTWDDFGLDSRLGIWQLLTRILPQSKKQGANILCQDSALRFWLEKGPCWRVSDTLKAIDRGDDGLELIVQVDYPNTRGRIGKLRKANHWALSKYWCRNCKQDVLGIFYDFDEFTHFAWFSNQTYEMLCLGCKLNMHLCYEADHRKDQKHHMVQGWLGDPNVANEEANLDKALTLESKKNGMKLAERYDRHRRAQVAKNAEEWPQKPRDKNVTCSPSINDRERQGFW